jgi:hypothetical protein
VVDAWALENKIRMAPDVDLLGFLLSEPVPKTVQKGGVRHNTRDFIAPELAPGMKVEVRESAEDAGRLAVFGADGAFFCMAVDAEMEGVDRAEIAARARHRQEAKEAAVRELAREAKKLVRPGAIAQDILAARKSSNVSVFQRPDYSGGTAAMAEMMLAGAADNLAARAAKEAAGEGARGGASGAAFAPAGRAAQAPDPAAMARAAALFEASGAASPGAETGEEPPGARYARLLRGGARGPGDEDFFAYFSQLPAARGIALAVEAAAAAC